MNVSDEVSAITESTAEATPPLQIYCSRHFMEWQLEQQLSIALTTYQTSRLLFLGLNPEGGLSGFERLFDRAMGLYATPERLYMSSRYQLWQFDNALSPGELYDNYDRLYIPRIGHTTGDLDIHDIAVEDSGRVVFISTLLTSLVTLSDHHSCRPIWKPPFISHIVNEDRCHLNGLAIVDGQARYVTACSQSDVVDGWRDRRSNGGCVIDICSDEVICSGLSMPHSPRFHQGRLWLLNSGMGELGYIDPDDGVFRPVAFCPGYGRGLAFWKNFAIVGLSRPRRDDRTFSGLPLDERLAAKESEPRCGLLVIDIKTGSVLHWLRIEGVIRELYDVQILPGVRRPMALGFQSDEIARLLTIEELSPLE